MTKLPDTPQKVEKSIVSQGKEPEIEGSSDEEYPTDLEDLPCIPLIFVMGVSGAGKSSFIKTLGGRDLEMKPPATSATESMTCEVEAYKAILDGQEMLLVDTPGFEDNKTSNLETLQKICEYILQVANNPACVIHGAIYVHSITTSRWSAGDQRTWSILQALCGDTAMGNVIVATTRWPADHKSEEFVDLEKINLENYWEGVLGTVRLAKDDVQNSRTAILMLLGVRPKTFQMQWELSSGNTPSDTSAGRISITEGEEALSKAEKVKEYALAELARVSSQIGPVQSQNAPKLPQPPPSPPDSAGRISTTEGEEVVSKVEKEREDALAEHARVSSQVNPVQPQNAPKLPQPPPSPPDSAGRISTTEGEEVLSKAEKDARAELGRISPRAEPVQLRDTQKLAQPPLPETKGPSAANIEEEMDALLQRLQSAIHANKSQLEKIKGSEETLQEEIQQVQALLKEKEDLLKKYHQLRCKIESPAKLKARLIALRTPISTRKISRKKLLAMLLVGGTVVVEVGSMNFPFYGFGAFSGLLLYRGVVGMISENANSTLKDSQASQTSDTEHRVPAINMNDGSDGDDERIERRRARARTKRPKGPKGPKVEMTEVKGEPAPQEPPPLTVQRRSSWFSFLWT